MADEQTNGHGAAPDGEDLAATGAPAANAEAATNGQGEETSKAQRSFGVPSNRDYVAKEDSGQRNPAMELLKFPVSEKTLDWASRTNITDEIRAAYLGIEIEDAEIDVGYLDWSTVIYMDASLRNSIGGENKWLFSRVASGEQQQIMSQMQNMGMNSIGNGQKQEGGGS